MHVAQIADEIGNEQEGILVMHSDGIDFPVVLYWSQLAVFFADEEE